MMDYTIFGESHGPAVGVLLRDVPPGLPVDEEFIRRQTRRHIPQQHSKILSPPPGMNRIRWRCSAGSIRA